MILPSQRLIALSSIAALLLGLVCTVPVAAHEYEGEWHPHHRHHQHGYPGWQGPYYAPPPVVYAPAPPRYIPVQPPLVVEAPPLRLEVPLPVWQAPRPGYWR